jgi:hypothetical protein
MSHGVVATETAVVIDRIAEDCLYGFKMSGMKSKTVDGGCTYES